MYFGNASSRSIKMAMLRGEIGYLCAPGGGTPPTGFPVWAADNACFGKKYPGDQGYLDWLARWKDCAPRCWFATAPDVVGDAEATLARSTPFLPAIRALGYRPAFVAQDGIARTAVPWDDFDVLFLGGSDAFKLGPEAFHITKCALQLGKAVHCGRVNSGKRLKYAYDLGCTSADGTFLAFGPDVNLPRLRDWYIDRSVPLPPRWGTTIARRRR